MTFLHAEEAGNPEGTPVMLLHGFLSSNAQWDLNREALGARLRLIQIELVGHGKSAVPDDAAAYGLPSVLAEIDTIRDSLSLDKVWLCGQSLGGGILLQYALAHPERVHGVVFTNTRAAFGLGRKQRPPAEGASAVPATTSLAPTTIRDLGVHPVHATRIPSPLHEKMIEAADQIPMYVVDHITTHRNVWRSVDRMGELSMPVLLVNGRWEKLFQPCVEEAQGAIAHLEVVTLEGGHAINVDQPEGFTDAVIDFISRH